MGPPKCPDCPHDRFVAELASPGMQERWAERVDIQWSWGRDGCAWFHLCQKCHLAEWPLDLRTNNASNRPGGGVAVARSLWWGTAFGTTGGWQDLLLDKACAPDHGHHTNSTSTEQL